MTRIGGLLLGSCWRAYLSIANDSVAGQPARGNRCVVLAPVLLEFFVGELGALVLLERHAEESFLGGHCFWWSSWME